MKALARARRHSFARFAAFGVLGLGFDVSLLAELGARTALSRTAAVTVAFGTTYLLNFFLNRRFSFAATGPTGSSTEDGVPGRLGGQLARFAPQLGLDFVLTLTAVDLLTSLGIAVLVARVLAGGSNAAVNYTMYRWWTFRPPAFVGTRPLH